MKTVLYTSAKDDCYETIATEPLAMSRAAPSSIFYLCPNCKAGHTFNAQKIYLLDTPRKRQAFERYCTTQGITETNVILEGVK